MWRVSRLRLVVVHLDEWYQPAAKEIYCSMVVVDQQDIGCYYSALWYSCSAQLKVKSSVLTHTPRQQASAMLHFCQNNVGGSVGMATPYDDTFKTFISENAQVH